MLSGQPERRAAQRFAASLPIAVKSVDGSFEPETALTRDVSGKGLFFYMGARPEQGARIEVTLTLPTEVTLSDPMRINARGRVVRVVPGRPGETVGVGATLEGYNSFIRLSRTE